MSKRQIFGLIGSIVLIIGVFTPIVSLPLVGTLTHFAEGEGDGVIVLALAVVSLFLVLAKKYKGLWLTGVGSLGLVTFTFINITGAISDVRSEMQGSELGELAIESVKLQWGWILLFAGAGLVIAAAAMKGGRSDKAARGPKVGEEPVVADEKS